MWVYTSDHFLKLDRKVDMLIYSQHYLTVSLYSHVRKSTQCGICMHFLKFSLFNCLLRFLLFILLQYCVRLNFDSRPPLMWILLLWALWSYVVLIRIKQKQNINLWRLVISIYRPITIAIFLMNSLKTRIVILLHKAFKRDHGTIHITKKINVFSYKIVCNCTKWMLVLGFFNHKIVQAI